MAQSGRTEPVAEHALEYLARRAFHRSVRGGYVEGILQAAAGERDRIIRRIVAERFRPGEV